MDLHTYLFVGLFLILLFVFYWYYHKQKELEDTLKFHKLVLEQIHESVIIIDLNGYITCATGPTTGRDGDFPLSGIKKTPCTMEFSPLSATCGAE